MNDQNLNHDLKPGRSEIEGPSLSSNVLQFLKRKWWLSVLAGLIGGLGGVWYSSNQPNKFVATTTFSMLENGGNMGGVFSIAAEFGINIGNTGRDIFAGDNIIVILSSRRIIEEVLLQIDTLENRKVTFAEELGDIINASKGVVVADSLITFKVGQPRDSFSYLQDSVLYRMYLDIVKSRLVARRPDKRLNFFEVQFSSPDERFSKKFLDRLIEATARFYTDLRVQKSKATLAVLEERVAAMRGGANSAIQSQAVIKDANINPAFSTANAALLNRQLDISAYGKAYEELFKNLEVARYQYLQDIPLFQLIDPPKLPILNAKKGRLFNSVLFACVSVFVSLVLSVSWIIIKRDLPKKF